MSDSRSESRWCLEDSRNSSLCTHNSDATWGNAVDFRSRHFLKSPFIWKEQERLFHVRVEKQGKADELQMKLGANYCAKTAALEQIRLEEWWWQRGWRSKRVQERKEKRARVRRAQGVITRSAQDRRGDRGGSVSDRLLVAPLWRLWSSDPSRNLLYYKASPLHTGTTTKWSNYI